MRLILIENLFLFLRYGPKNRPSPKMSGHTYTHSTMTYAPPCHGAKKALCDAEHPGAIFIKHKWVL